MLNPVSWDAHAFPVYFGGTKVTDDASSIVSVPSLHLVYFVTADTKRQDAKWVSFTSIHNWRVLNFKSLFFFSEALLGKIISSTRLDITKKVVISSTFRSRDSHRELSITSWKRTRELSFPTSVPRSFWWRFSGEFRHHKSSPSTWLIFCLFHSIITCMMGDTVRSKPWLGLLGNVSAVMATAAAFGLAMYLRVDFIGINLAAPFLMIGECGISSYNF